MDVLSSGHRGHVPTRTAGAPDSQSSNTAAGGAPSGPPTPGHPSFRRCVPTSRRPARGPQDGQRASKACQTCRARKVRCDATLLGVPCTNCSAFSITCVIPARKPKKTQLGKQKDLDNDRGDAAEDSCPQGKSPSTQNPLRNSIYNVSRDGAIPPSLKNALPRNNKAVNAQFVKPKFTRAPLKEAGRVAYLGESSNLTLLVRDHHSAADVVHYPLPRNAPGSHAGLTELDEVETGILRQRGAFLLPPRLLCDELVDSYFKWVAPIVPVINQTRFMKQYQDTKNPPSLLLLQAILLAGSKVCTNPRLMDVNGSTTPAAITFYKRAKALYDAEYEDDRVTIVQALVLMSWYWEGPEDVTKNGYYWSRVATVVAQGSGMHRSVEDSQLSVADRRLWKRIWWTLFTRDRSVSVALGQPVYIDTADSDVEMVSEDDFIEDDDPKNEFAQDPVHVQFFLQYVKLCEIMGLVLSQQYSVASIARRPNAIDISSSTVALANWLQNCPTEVSWEMPWHHFWAALLHLYYYTALCLLHHAHIAPASRQAKENPYSSCNTAYHAAAMITSIIENLSEHKELEYCPAFIVYSLFSALIMHVYQMRSNVPSVVQAAQEQMRVCMNALKTVSRVWLVAKMVYKVFESILADKALEERLQKAPDYDDISLDFGVTNWASDTWTKSSAPQVPISMHVGDWLQFFGINEDLSGMNDDVRLG